jgi:glycine/D-amino acid oxidase-like deaminating enzyme
MDQNSKIVVVGAGLFGLATAKQLASEGYRNILVVDRHMPPVIQFSVSFLGFV